MASTTISLACSSSLSSAHVCPIRYFTVSLFSCSSVYSYLLSFLLLLTPYSSFLSSKKYRTPFFFLVQCSTSSNGCLDCAECLVLFSKMRLVMNKLHVSYPFVFFICVMKDKKGERERLNRICLQLLLVIEIHLSLSVDLSIYLLISPSICRSSFSLLTFSLLLLYHRIEICNDLLFVHHLLFGDEMLLFLSHVMFLLHPSAFFPHHCLGIVGESRLRRERRDKTKSTRGPSIQTDVSQSQYEYSNSEISYMNNAKDQTVADSRKRLLEHKKKHASTRPPPSTTTTTTAAGLTDTRDYSEISVQPAENRTSSYQSSYGNENRRSSFQSSYGGEVPSYSSYREYEEEEIILPPPSSSTLDPPKKSGFGSRLSSMFSRSKDKKKGPAANEEDSLLGGTKSGDGGGNSDYSWYGEETRSGSTSRPASNSYTF